LEENDIQSYIFYAIPLHLQEANWYLGYKEGDLPNAEKLCSQVIALPMYAEMKYETVELVAGKINEFVGKL
jgi:dTDP-4-amino-4,6-dideoxygalactose transaminase